MACSPFRCGDAGAIGGHPGDFAVAEESKAHTKSYGEALDGTPGSTWRTVIRPKSRLRRVSAPCDVSPLK